MVYELISFLNIRDSPSNFFNPQTSTLQFYGETLINIFHTIFLEVVEIFHNN